VGSRGSERDPSLREKGERKDSRLWQWAWKGMIDEEKAKGGKRQNS